MYDRIHHSFYICEPNFIKQSPLFTYEMWIEVQNMKSEVETGVKFEGSRKYKEGILFMNKRNFIPCLIY
jgi:hypothetical protein